MVPGKEQKNICVAAHNDYNLDAGGKIARESWFKGQTNKTFCLFFGERISYKEFWAIFDGRCQKAYYFAV